MSKEEAANVKEQHPRQREKSSANNLGKRLNLFQNTQSSVILEIKKKKMTSDGILKEAEIDQFHFGKEDESRVYLM